MQLSVLRPLLIPAKWLLICRVMDSVSLSVCLSVVWDGRQSVEGRFFSGGGWDPHAGKGNFLGGEMGRTM